MVEVLCAAGISLAVTVLAGFILIPVLRKLKFGQSILEIGPSWHMPKQGTPTMGGLMFIIGIAVATVVVGWTYVRQGITAHLIILAFALLFGGIGFIDDYCKVARKQNQGLTALQKLMLQAAVSACFLALLSLLGYLNPDVYIPFLQVVVPIPWVIFLFLLILLVTGMVNAVNFTDGVDGLCSGVTLPVAAFFTVLGVWWLHPELALLAGSFAGGLIGFLFFNFHPAKVFMGDTGSLFLGGMVCGLAIAYDVPLVLIPIGLIYIAEIVSVVLQVTYFKLTGGKRLFRMSPLHHHFEMSGWSEKKLFTVFSCISLLLCAITLWSLQGR